MPAAEIIELESATVRVRLVARGAAIFGIETLDRHGQLAEITVGCESLDDFYRNSAAFGASCGRFANRIAKGRFRLDGRDYQVACNDGPNSLHGGDAAFHQRDWSVAEVDRDADGRQCGVRFELSSPDGDGGYPGALQVSAYYQLSTDGQLSLTYFATTDAATVVNLTNHVYWNLSGVPSSNIRDHVLQMRAAEFLPIDSNYLPLGERLPVDNTPFDFRRGASLGDRLDHPDPQIAEMRGIDHAMVIEGEGLRSALRLEHPVSGRWLEMQTDQPAVHLYTGGFLSDEVPGKAGGVTAPHAGVALESENFPDAPNRPDFPSAELRPGQRYLHRIVWRFGCDLEA